LHFNGIESADELSKAMLRIDHGDRAGYRSTRDAVGRRSNVVLLSVGARRLKGMKAEVKLFRAERR
jgi:hypothetical protein